jgi:hypothetical protein
VGWDAALKDRYYIGLNDAVGMNRPEESISTVATVEAAIRIDSRQYERRLEGAGHYDRTQTKGKRYYGLQPMELDVIGWKRSRKR